MVRRSAQQPSDILHRQRVILFHRFLESGPIERADIGEYQVFEFLSEVHRVRTYLPGASLHGVRRVARRIGGVDPLVPIPRGFETG